MNRCDFSAITTILRNYMSEDKVLNQLVFLEKLFEHFANDWDEKKKELFVFDHGLSCRWINGGAKISPRISGYYLKRANLKFLAQDIENNILPLLYDSDMAVQELYHLLIQDGGISQVKKTKLAKRYPAKNEKEKSLFIAQVLVFGMECAFVKRDPKTKELIETGNRSPVVRDRILNASVPLPCAHFCGREQELTLLHALLRKEDKVFVSGVAGIGKSELIKAYAKRYKKEYTNILYIAYSGDLKQNIINLDFADDMLQESQENLFQQHNRFLRSLKEDTLLVIDNFNVPISQEELISVVLNYRCRVMITTRNTIKEHPVFPLAEIASKEDLFHLVSCFYADAGQQRALVEQVITQVHSHTLAVEMAARLLETGLLEPNELLEKLCEEKAALSSTDTIGVTKDGKRKKATYYEHLHLLFSLFELSGAAQSVLRHLAIMPFIDVPTRLFAKWLKLPNLNAVNDLIELGLIQSAHGCTLSMHPLISEIAKVDTAPSTENCRALLERLQEVCLKHGATITYASVLFQAIESIIQRIEKTDMRFYLLFLGDVFPCMEQYCYAAGMKTVLKELEIVLKQSDVGTEKDHAKLFDYQSAYEYQVCKDTPKAIAFEKRALACIPTVTQENAHLVSNICANLGAMYREQQQFADAEKYMERGALILKEQGLVYTHDSIPQLCNYAMLLADMKQARKGIAVLDDLSRWMKKNGLDFSADYAMVLQIKGYLSLLENLVEEARKCFWMALQLYRVLFSENPMVVEEKKAEIQSYILAAAQNTGNSGLLALEV